MASHDETQDDLTHPIYNNGSKGNQKKTKERESFLDFLSNNIVRAGVFPVTLTFGQAKRQGRLDLAVNMIKEVRSTKGTFNVSSACIKTM